MESNAMDIVEVPIFTGIGLRQWIDWMENRFVFDDYTDFQKLHLAHGFVEGEADNYVRWRTSVMPFQSWDAMKESLLLVFGTDDDPERIDLVLERQRRWEELRQSIKAKQSFQQINSEKIKMNDAIVVEESITKKETVTVEKFSNQPIFFKESSEQVDENTREKKQEKQNDVDLCFGVQSLDVNHNAIANAILTDPQVNVYDSRKLQLNISNEHQKENSLLNNGESTLMMGDSDRLVKPVEIPVFTGVYPCGWISRVERFFRRGHYIDEEKLRLVSMKLEDNVLSWFKHISFNNWKDFKSRLYVRFGNITSQYSLITVSDSEVILGKESFQEAVSSEEKTHVIGAALVQQKTLFCNVDSSYALEDLTSAVLVNKKFDSYTNDRETWMVQKMEHLHIFDVLDVDALAEHSPGLTDNHNTNQLFVLMPLRVTPKQKQRRCLKAWMFKFKNRAHTREWVQEKLCLKEPTEANVDKGESCPVIDSNQKPESWHSKDSVLVTEMSHQQQLLQGKQSHREMALSKESCGSNELLVMNPPLMHQRNNVLVDWLSHQSTSVTYKRKPRKYPKAWKYKFKHQLFAIKDNKSISCSRAKFGVVRKRRGFQSPRLQNQAHMSRVLCNMRMIQDSNNLKQLIGDRQPMNKAVGGVDKLVTLGEADTLLSVELAYDIKVTKLVPITTTIHDIDMEIEPDSMLQRVREQMIKRDTYVMQHTPFDGYQFGETKSVRMKVVCVLCLGGIHLCFTSLWKRRFCKDWWFKFKHNTWTREAFRLWEKNLLEVQHYKSYESVMCRWLILL